MADNALYGLPQQYRGQNALVSGQQEPVMRSYQEPWYRALPNRLTDYIYGPNANAQQAAGVRHLVGPENPLNLPAQFSEGVDTARTGYQLGNNLMTGLGAFQAMTALPIPGAKVAGQVAKQEAKGIRAYHGSPHDFDKFDASKIGTGEGAQAFGHGLYFAENEGVAREYKNALSKIVMDGKSPDWDNPKHWIAMAVHDANGDKAKAIKFLEKYQMESSLSDRPVIEKAWQEVAAGKIPQELPKVTDHGRMYEVRINADPEHFLDWDKPISQQSQQVRSSLEAFDPTTTLYDDTYKTGDVINQVRGTKGQVEQALREAGIPGIKYLDQGSRTAGEGSRNYVVFDPATIEILRKYGLLGLMSGSVAAGAMPQQSNALYGGQ